MIIKMNSLNNDMLYYIGNFLEFNERIYFLSCISLKNQLFLILDNNEKIKLICVFIKIGVLKIMLQPRFFRFFSHLTWRTLKKTFVQTIETRLLGLAAEIAFNAMLSLFPAILSLLTAMGLFSEFLRHTFIQLARELSKIVPQEAWILIRDFATHEIANSKNSSLFSLSFVLTLWAASGAISTAMTALDRIQQLHPKNL